MILSTSKLLKLKQFSFSKNIYFKVSLSNYYQLPKYLISKKIISGNRYRHNKSTGSDNIFGKMAATIQQSSSFLVMAGAGLSTPSGIPDFRSPDTGLYAKLQKYNLPYPEAIFDIDYFMMDSKPFFTLAQDLYPGVWHKPNVGHFFLRLLQMEKKLQRLYTQNIDGLERLAGITEDKLVESHGTFSSATCTLCCEKHDINMVKDSILNGNTPIICRRKGCKGQVKPDIVFFGENLPKKFWNFEEDVLTTDALLVIGTSLEVYPFAGIAEAVGRDVPRLLINRELVGSFGQRPGDLVCTGDLVQTVTTLAKTLRWDENLERSFIQPRVSGRNGPRGISQALCLCSVVTGGFD